MHSADLDEAERSLGESIPMELRSLLGETDGIIGQTSSDAVWPLEKIVRDNLRFRHDESLAGLYMPFDSFLFFGDNGGGDHFAFVLRPARMDIFVWQHESDSRKWVASNLQDYIARRLRQGGDDWYETY
ncbi:SMI1/KNR4 family protein [Streptomyces sp. NPDC050507]|uniref:SMI1/KNR4 family protein n=1 Tax=Streptomyces sp. NPDC050507 TaxID=3365619 RepID=UPI003796462E